VLKYFEVSPSNIFILKFVYMCHILIHFCSSNFCSPRDDEVKAIPVHAMTENAGVNV